MVYGDLQFFDIIIFAAVAVFLIYRLRGVLGKRTGFQKDVSPAKTPPKAQDEIKTEKRMKKVLPLSGFEPTSGRGHFELLVSPQETEKVI